MKDRKNIILIGFMGTGKTTVSRQLQQTYGLRMVDMDIEIERREGRKIPEIFAEEGEEYFRNLETELLRELQLQEDLVISCGGGTPLRACNVVEMKKNGIVFLLDASPELIYERVKNSHHRPLLEQNKSVEAIRKLLASRQERYEAAANVVITVDERSTDEICREILRKRREA